MNNETRNIPLTAKEAEILRRVARGELSSSAKTSVASLLIREGTHADAEAAAALLASGLVPRGAQAIHMLLDGGGLLLLAEIDSVLVGVATAAVTHDLKGVVPAGNEDLVEKFQGSYPLGIIKQIVVLAWARGEGIATAFIDRQVEWMRETVNARVAYADAWVYPDGTVPASGPLKNCGFELIERVENFWTEESIGLDYSCGPCAGTCHCAADVFVLDLEETTK